MRKLAPEGYHREWCVDEQWKIGGDGKSCRQRGCGKPAVAALRRRHIVAKVGFTWWHYCEVHLYGRKIEDGAVKVERLVKNTEAAS